MKKAVLHICYADDTQEWLNIKDIIGVCLNSEDILLITTLKSDLQFRNVRSFYIAKA